MRWGVFGVEPTNRWMSDNEVVMMLTSLRYDKPAALVV